MLRNFGFSWCGMSYWYQSPRYNVPMTGATLFHSQVHLHILVWDAWLQAVGWYALNFRRSIEDMLSSPLSILRSHILRSQCQMVVSGFDSISLLPQQHYSGNYGTVKTNQTYWKSITWVGTKPNERSLFSVLFKVTQVSSSFHVSKHFSGCRVAATLKLCETFTDGSGVLGVSYCGESACDRHLGGG